MEGVLLSLAVLACPVGMLVMGWVMVKGMRGERGAARGSARGEAPERVDDLRAEHRRLGAEIERIDGGGAVENARPDDEALLPSS